MEGKNSIILRGVITGIFAIGGISFLFHGEIISGLAFFAVGGVYLLKLLKNRDKR